MRLKLIRDPRFAEAVQDIVVEFGSGRFQDTIDAFVNGAEVAYESLRRVWTDTTQPDAIWDSPIYEEFFRAVREVNAKLPRERRLRVLLGDPPIDWDAVKTLEDLSRFAIKRDEHAADVIRRESLARGRKALVIYGDQHFTRANSGGIVARLEGAGAKVFSVHSETRADLAPQPVGTVALQGANDPFDAVLFLGPFPSMTFDRIAPALCADSKYMEMRLRRMAILPPPPGAPMAPIERLKEHCRAVMAK